MGAVKDVVMDIREALYARIEANEIIDAEVRLEIAEALKIPVYWVEDAYKDIMDDYYEGW